jgi:hypothetical protein
MIELFLRRLTPVRVCVGAFLALSALAAFTTVYAQAPGNTDPTALLKNLEQVELKHFNALDLDALAGEDELNDALPGAPRRYAIPRKVRFSPENSGTWSQSSQGRSVWRLRVTAEGAAHLNFGFSRFALPEGAALTLISVDGQHKLGPFTSGDMLTHGQLWTPVLMGEEAMIHLDVATGDRDSVVLDLTQINQGYRGFGIRSKVCKSGSCNTDVACLSPGDPWNENRRAVGALSYGGSAFCTGSLLNNTANDRRMLFATATHCGVNDDSAAATAVVYWNYESAVCRVPGSAESGAPPGPPPASTSQGLRFLAGTNNPFDGGGSADSRSDWSLLELAEPPADNDFNLFWAGWDRRPPPTTCAAPGDVTGTAGLCASIHHPSGDEKRITFVEVPMTVDDIAAAVGVHWLANWDPTPPELPLIDPLPATLPPSVTEPGSSGSPLYNADRRLVGVLSGGASFCGVAPSGLNDQYGGLFHAWEGLGTVNTRMRDHLDPLGNAPQFIDGLGSCDAPPVPTLLQVSATADNEVTVSWGAVAQADRYRVFRSTGTCPGTNFVQVGEVVGTSFIDTDVSGGTAYVYRVASVDDDADCVSVQSDCLGTTATGTCTLAPTFSGLVSAASAGTSSCGIDLAWSAATSNCGSDAQIRYNVYRSESADFLPSSGTLIAACQNPTDYLDAQVSAGNTFHYLVRAEDLGANKSAGRCGGVEEDNLLRRAAAAFGPPQSLFDDDVESGGGSWLATGTGPGGADFAIVTDASRSPVSSWFVPDPDGLSDRRLTLAEAVTLPPGPGGQTLLSFAHRFDLEDLYDGGVLEYSIDNGATWQDMLEGTGAIPANAGRFLANGYTAVISDAFGSPIGGRQAWTGNSGGSFVDTVVDLSDFVGEELLLRFRFASDTSVSAVGWWIDDVAITRSSTCAVISAEPVFQDGFEP